MERLSGDPSKDPASELIEQLECESVVSLNEWRHNLATQLDNWLFLSEELDFLERHGTRLNEVEQYAYTSQLYARAREYMDYESKQLEPRLTRFTPVRVHGRLLWHSYGHDGSTFVTEELADGLEIKGQYIKCDIAPYYAADAIGTNPQERGAYYRNIGVHMVLHKPLICDVSTGRVVSAEIDEMYIPLHYVAVDFEASFLDDE